MPTPRFLIFTDNAKAKRAGGLFRRAARKFFQASQRMLEGLEARQRILAQAEKIGNREGIAPAIASLDRSLGEASEKVCGIIGGGKGGRPEGTTKKKKKGKKP